MIAKAAARAYVFAMARHGVAPPLWQFENQ